VIDGLHRQLVDGCQPLEIPSLPLRFTGNTIAEHPTSQHRRIKISCGHTETLNLFGLSSEGVIVPSLMQHRDRHQQAQWISPVGSHELGAITVELLAGRLF
jgi:hypothetical protein